MMDMGEFHSPPLATQLLNASFLILPPRWWLTSCVLPLHRVFVSRPWLVTPPPFALDCRTTQRASAGYQRLWALTRRRTFGFLC